MKKLSLFASLASLFCCRSSQSQPLKAGDPVPPVTVTDHTGNSLDISLICHHGMSLLYFFPKADTPG